LKRKSQAEQLQLTAGAPLFDAFSAHWILAVVVSVELNTACVSRIFEKRKKPARRFSGFQRFIKQRRASYGVMRRHKVSCGVIRRIRRAAWIFS
jgi:hypothetical protein